MSVFISYSHDSPRFSEYVRDLSDSLRRDGVDAEIDQYVDNPAEGWPKWMDRQIELAHYVLVMCTKGYHEKLNGITPRHIGSGIKWESLLTYQSIYDQGSLNRRFIPVVCSHDDVQYIPRPLKAFTIYRLKNDYDALVKRLKGIAQIEKPPVGILDTCTESSSPADRMSGSSQVVDIVDTTEIELKVNENITEYSTEKQDALLRAIQVFLKVDYEIRIIRKRPGCTILTLELTLIDAERLLWAVKRGEFDGLKVLDANLLATSHKLPALQTDFPPFSLLRLLKTVFNPVASERVCILIDLPDPTQVKDFAFLTDPKFSIQQNAYNSFYLGLRDGVMAELGLTGGEMFAYKLTGGSNLDLPDEAWNTAGRQLSLSRDIYPAYKIILCISTYSATAPLTAFAKQYGFRGATIHGLNQIILNSGLAVDYNEVSRLAEKLRLGMTRADWVEIDFLVDGGHKHTLHLDLGRQEAQKSHGLCRGGPNVANLPAGEIYYVPTGAEGEFPMRYEDGTLGLMTVSGSRIVHTSLIRGDEATIIAHQKKLVSDPVTGELSKLGFGTQELPVSGRNIQDAKILGTVHVATGRSDYLGGHLTPDKFADSKNAKHDNILFSSSETPEITVTQIRMNKDGVIKILIEDYSAVHMRELLEA